MEQEEVICIKVYDQKKGDVVFEGKVSADVAPHELVHLGCFCERNLPGIFNKATEKPVVSFKGLQDAELVARRGDYQFSIGVLYVGAHDGVLRKTKLVPSCNLTVLSVWGLLHEECEKVFKCETLEQLEINYCQLKHMPSEIMAMKKLTKLRLDVLDDLKTIPEEIGELTSLQELRIVFCAIESLPKRLKDLKMLKSICLEDTSNLQLHADDLVVFSKLKQLRIAYCAVFTPLSAQAFWEMIKLTTDLRCLDLDWCSQEQYREVVAAALEENGSIVHGGLDSELYAHIFKRNRENHEKAMACVLQLLTIRRWRDVLNYIPKEIMKMIAMMLWNTRCDAGAWSTSEEESTK